jgi:hypothetical protein
MASNKFYELLEQAPDYAKETAALFSWSENYNFPSPASLFLDLIGWSDEELGERLTRETMPDLGYMEIDYLADALKEYAARPLDILLFVSKLMADYSEEVDA